MFTKHLTPAEAVQVLDGRIATLTELRSAIARAGGGGPVAFQLTPTTSYWMTYGTDVLFKVPSIGNTVVVTPWKKLHEHWYRNPGSSAEVLASNGDLTITLQHACTSDELCEALKDDLDGLIAASWKLQLYADGVLDETNWSTDVPTLTEGSTRHFYEGSTPEGSTARVLLEVVGDDLVQTVWLSETDKLDAYFKSKNVGNSIILSHKGSSFPNAPTSDGWYYYSAKA